MKALFFITLAVCLSMAHLSCSRDVAIMEPSTWGASSEPKIATIPKATIDSIREIAVNSSCANYDFRGRGRPFKSFLRGISLSYARSLCRLDLMPIKVVTQPVGKASKDVLAHYAARLTALGLKTSTEVERLRHVYAIMVGSAARESGWRWCAGHDVTADNVTADMAEAGLYQTSYDSHSVDPELNLTYADFKNSDEGCFASDYQGILTCSAGNMQNWGTGEGVTFQKLSKACPGFATEYHAVMLRVDRAHYGPINRREVELRPECDRMMESIEAILKVNPELCTELGS